MADSGTWLSILALVKAIFDAVKSGTDLATAYESHRNEEDTIYESNRVSLAFASTYSDAEVDALLKRLEACRDRFIAEGSGPQRARCLCSVLQDIKDGNGGQIPVIDDWANIYAQLNCSVGA